MNNKKLKNLLKEKADKVVVRDCCDEILEKTHHVVKPTPQPVPVQKIYKKRWFYPAVSAIIATCLLVVAIPLGLFNPSGAPSIPTIAEINRVFSQEVMAIGNVVSDLSVGGGAQGQSLATNLPQASTFNAVVSYSQTQGSSNQQVAEEINGYLLTGVSLAGKQVFSSENTDADYGNYKKKVVVTYSDLSISYTYYYNETKTSKRSCRFDGVIVVDGNEYSLNGGWKKESDELEMYLTVKTGENSFIKFTNEQESEEDEFETEYSYRFIENGVTVKSVYIELEKEDDESEMEIRIEQSGKTTVCEFEFYSDYIYCYHNGNKIKIEITANTYKYLFNGQTIELPKNSN